MKKEDMIKDEILEKDLKTKSVFYYIDEERDIKVKSKEVYKKKKLEVHYPFNRYSGESKYNNIKKFSYVGIKKLPRGFLKSVNTGYGCTKLYNPLLYRLEDRFDVQEVIFSDSEVCRIENKKLYLSFSILDKHYDRIDTLFKQQKQDKSILVDKILSEVFPTGDFEVNDDYIPGSLASFVDNNLRKEEINFSSRDVEAVNELLQQFSPEEYSKVDTEKFLTTKANIERIYIEDVLQKFENLMERKHHTDSLEEQWHVFFKNYSWIFSQLFTSPLLFIEDKAYAGGKDIGNKNSKIADFVYKNKLTNNIAFIEIKTHKASLLKQKPYRGDDVFQMDKDLSGGINQVLDQKDNFQKEFYTIKGNSKQEFESFNPKCILVIGSVSDLTKEQERSFELYRSNSKDVEIITFDELWHKLKALETIITG